MPQEKPNPRDVLTPDTFALLRRIADTGSFAAAARAVGMVPSALTYRVRQIEEVLDVLLFDRSARQARLTEAGRELVHEGGRLLDEIDAMANRVRRVATGWEPHLTLALDGVINRTTVLELCERFLAMAPPTRLRLRDETLSGTLEALTSGEADLALGLVVSATPAPDLLTRPLGELRFIFAVAPHHPLARAPEPLSDAVLRQHRAVAVADSTRRGEGVTHGLLDGQEVFTVPDLPAKLEAQLRGLGAGFLPECMARPYIDSGRLVERPVERQTRNFQLSYAWRKSKAPGKAIQWWLEQLDNPVTRQALLNRGRSA